MIDIRRVGLKTKAVAVDLVREEVKDQLIRWLSYEKSWSFQEHPDPNYYFTCKVQMSEGLGCNVCTENDIERVDIIANGKFSK